MSITLTTPEVINDNTTVKAIGIALNAEAKSASVTYGVGHMNGSQFIVTRRFQVTYDNNPQAQGQPPSQSFSDLVGRRASVKDLQKDMEEELLFFNTVAGTIV